MLSCARDVLKPYAERGVFRSFSEIAVEKSRAEFRFRWLWNLPFHLTCDQRQGTICFRNVFPGILLGSQLETELKEFIESLSSPDRPEHRRVDRSRLIPIYTNRRNIGELMFKIGQNDYSYAVRNALNIVNEIFLSFLSVRYPEYMTEKLKLPEE